MMVQTALILIDFQNEFADLFDEKLIESLQQLIQFARKRNFPIFWIKSYYQVTEVKSNSKKSRESQDLKNGTHKGKPMCIEGTDGAEFYSDIAQFRESTDTVMIKNFYNCFKGTNLDVELRKLDITQLIFCGVTCNNCVHAGILGAYEKEYQILIALDCIRSFSSKRQEEAIEDIRSCGKILRNQELFEHLNNFPGCSLLQNVLPKNEFILDMDEVLFEMNWEAISPALWVAEFLNNSSKGSTSSLTQNLMLSMEKYTNHTFDYLTLFFDTGVIEPGDPMNSSFLSSLLSSMDGPLMVYLLGNSKTIRLTDPESNVITLESNSLLKWTDSRNAKFCFESLSSTDPSTNRWNGKSMFFIFSNQPVPRQGISLDVERKFIAKDIIEKECINTYKIFNHKLTTICYGDDRSEFLQRTMFYVNWSIPNMRVTFLLNELEISCKYRRVFVMTDENFMQSLEFAEINPFQLSPTFIDQGMVFIESIAIIHYLIDQYSEQTHRKLPNFFGQNIIEKNKILAVGYQSDDLRKIFKIIEKAFYHPIPEIEENISLRSSIYEAEKNLLHNYDIIEADLANRWRLFKKKRELLDDNLYLFGNSLTFADVLLYPVLAYQSHRGFLLNSLRFPCLTKYMEMMQGKKLNPMDSNFQTLHISKKLRTLRQHENQCKSSENTENYELV